MPATRRRPRVESMPDQLRRLVREDGTSAYALARAAGIHDSQVSRWLRGDRDLSFESAGRLAAALGVEPLRLGRRRAASLPADRARPDPRRVVAAPDQHGTGEVDHRHDRPATLGHEDRPDEPPVPTGSGEVEIDRV